MDKHSEPTPPADLAPGGHLCCLYENEAEHRDLLLPFLRRGLARGERVVCIADAQPARAILDLFASGVREVAPYLAGGQLAFLPPADVQLRDGSFDPERMLAFLRAETARALSEGYAALRVTGEMHWALGGASDAEQVIAHEEELTAFLSGGRCLLLCRYDRRRVAPELLLSLLRAHPLIALGGERRAQVVRPGAAEGDADRAVGLQAVDARLRREIAERRRLEERLRESEARHRFVVEGSQDAILLTVPDGRILAANPAACRLFGMSEEEIRQAGRDGLIDTADPRLPAAVEERARTGRFSGELRFRRKTGQLFDGEITSAIFTDPSGERRTSTVIRDVTERRRTESVLRENEARYRRLFEEATEGIALADVESGILVDCNAAFERLSGYSREELVGRPQTMLHPPEDAVGPVTRNFASYRNHREGQTLVSTLVTKRGAHRQVEVKANLLSLGGRRLLQGFFRDVTDETRSRQERETTLALLRLLNDRNHTHELIREVTGLLQGWTGCEAVGVRLQDDDDFPYYETRGFPPEFVAAENSLCAREPDGRPLRDGTGRPVLECMCGNILCGRFDPSLPFFSARGSFWTNSTSRLLAGSSEVDRRSRTRNRCHGEGYESVALIPLRHGHETLGLLQLNDRAPDRFTPELIAFLENAGDQIAIALAQRQAQTALAESEEKYHTLFEAMAEGVFCQRADGRLIDVNRAALEMLGMSRDQFLGRTSEHPEWNVIAEDGSPLPPAQHPSMLALRTGKAVREKTVGVLDPRSREYRWMVVNAIPHLRPGETRPTQVFATLHDITAHKRAEDARALLQRAVEHAAEAIVITDAAAIIQYVNPAFEQITGYGRTEVVGQSPRILQGGRHDAAFYREMWGCLARGESWTGDFINRRKDGSLYEELAVISPVKNTAGETVNYVAVKRDVTREREMERLLRQAQKLEAVGRLAGGVAHDFNNLLFLILGSARLLLEERPKLDALSRGLLEDILAAGTRAASLTDQLLIFSRRQPRQPQALDLCALVAGLRRMLRGLLGRKIRLITHLAPEAAPVYADPGQLEQVVINLAINARDAMPDGGTLTISVRRAYGGGDPGVGDGTLATLPTLDPQSAPANPQLVELRVTDTGTGMAEEILPHLFEPFFTTKPRGKGTGLGLATVHGIVAQSGGSIRVTSAVGQGTAFSVLLPLSSTPARPASTSPAGPAAPGGSETILVVEDEAPTRQLVARFLHRLGYIVLEAGDGPEALALATQHPGRIHLLLTDVVMPGMDGIEVARRVVAWRPGLPVLYMSGHLSEIPDSPRLLDPTTRLLRKPFTSDELARCIRQTLDR